MLGDVLLSQGESPTTIGAESLTSVFGMGTGVTSLLSLPNLFQRQYYYTVFEILSQEVLLYSLKTR